MNLDEARLMLERVEAIAADDSDVNADVDVPPLDQVIGWQLLKRIDPKLRKLQEGVNGSFALVSQSKTKKRRRR